jgi:uncharacterized repeat protein (TIGR01451 family)
MIKTCNNIFTELDIDFIFNLPEVKKAKEDIDIKSEGSIYFTIDITPEIQKTIFNNLGLNLSNVPMRWIKGDTKPHVDHGQTTFNNTYLVYLTDSLGEFIVDNNSYSITKGCGYVFSEGLEHQTINTGLEPRLLLGPMSEEGFAVGEAITITADGATQTIYFYYSTDPFVGVYYKINQTEYFGISLPITIVNSNTSSTLKVLFENDIPISNNIFYFICGSNNIQFGSTSLQNDGTRPIITIDDSVIGYEGLIKNGDSFGNGFNNIYIYNIEINAIESSLTSNSGWFGREYFATGASDCYIVNCHSDGPIIDAGGGIVGGYAASNSGNLQIIGCSSSGNSGTYSGGIVGYYAAQSGGNVTCTGCWSTGIIGPSSGGIFGYGASDTLGSVTATNCYSTGLINPNGGGIFGREAATNNGVANAEYCYSQGIISLNAGGIFGSNAGGIFGSNAGLGTTAVNCYSRGTIATLGNGIYGTDAENDNISNCYVANGTWNSTTANTRLAGTPVSPSVIGTTWVATILNEPYELLNIGYTPYTIDIISVSGGVPSLVRTLSETIVTSSSTNAAIISGKSYTIIQKSGGDLGSYSTISINSTTGAILTTSSTTPGTYTITIRNTGSYNITNFELTVTGSFPPQIQINNKSFRVSNLFLDDLENSILLGQSGNGGTVSDSFNIYDVLLLELVNEAFINQ